MASEVILVPGIMTANHRKTEGTWRSARGAGQGGYGPDLEFALSSSSHILSDKTQPHGI